jgi:hypothetical protein
VNELQDIELVEPYRFTKGCRLMKIEASGSVGSLNPYLWGSMLFDLQFDPGQEHPIMDQDIEKRMAAYMVELMRQTDAPAEQYLRIGLPKEGEIFDKHLCLSAAEEVQDRVGNTAVTWRQKGKKMYYTLLELLPFWMKRQFIIAVEKEILERDLRELDENLVVDLFQQLAPEEEKHLLDLVSRIVIERG